MILVGLLFFGWSVYLGNLYGYDWSLTSHRYLGRRVFSFLAFIGGASGLTAVVHFMYLLTSWPRQHFAGLIAIGTVGLFGCAVTIVEIFM